MAKLHQNTDPRVKDVYDNFSEPIKSKLSELRQLIIETAEQTEGLTVLEETLKWGEPSFLTKHGSTIRMNKKKHTTDTYAMYFQCTSKLVSTFRMVYKNMFTFEGNRALVLHIDDDIPETELKACIMAALRYHKVKHLPTLGM